MIKEQTCLTKKDVAKILGVCERSVYRYWQSGKIPKPMVIGGMARWLREEFMEWLKKEYKNEGGT